MARLSVIEKIATFFDAMMKERLALNPLMVGRLSDRSNNDKWPKGN